MTLNLKAYQNSPQINSSNLDLSAYTRTPEEYKDFTIGKTTRDDLTKERIDYLFSPKPVDITDTPEFKKMEIETERLEREAEYLHSPIGMMMGTIKELPSASRTLLKDLTRETLTRPGARLAYTIKKHLSGAETVSFQPGTGPFPKLEKFLYGEDVIKDYETESEEFAKAIGLGDQTAKELAIPIAIGYGLLDFYPPTSTSKIYKGVAKNIAKTSDVKIISKELEKVIVKGADEEIDALAKGFKNITDPKDVEKTLIGIGNAQNTLKAGKETITDDISIAKAEGKSFEEFLEGQGEELIHITKEKNVQLIESSGLKATKKTTGSISEGISLAGRRNEVNKIFGDSEVNVYINPNAKKTTMSKALDAIGFQKERTVKTIGMKNAEREAIEWAKKNNFDVLDMRDAKSSVYADMDEIRVFNSEMVKTKSQLKQQWDKVGKEPVKTRPPSLEKLGLKEKPTQITKGEDILLKSKLRSEAKGAKRGIAYYKREQALVEKVKKEIQKEISKPKARQRSTIAFVKKIGEFNQTVVNEVKREIGLTKSIKKSSLEELNKLLGGMKERLAFKVRQGFNPQLVEKSVKPIRISEELYKKNRKIGITKPSKIEEAKEMATTVGKGADILLGPISTRLKNIDPIFKRKMRKFEWDIRQTTKKDLEVAVNFLEKIKHSKKKGMSVDDYADYDLALKNRDIFKINELNKKYNIEKEYSAVRKTLDDIYKRAEDVGYDIGYFKDYHPRITKDIDGFLNHFQKRDDWSLFEEVIKRKEMELGRYLKTEEQVGIIDNMIRGYKGGNITLSKTGAMKNRVVDFVSPELNKFYMDSGDALVRYIKQTNEAIEARKFFGKARTESGLVEKSTDQFSNINDSIGTYVAELLFKGKITVNQEKTLSNILKARFNPKGTSGVMGVYKNLAYIDVMGSPYNAITQIGDIGFSMYSGGVIRTLREIPKSIIGKSPITKKEIGIERIAIEFSDTGSSGRAVDKVFGLVGLKKIDSIGKETLINSTIARLMEQSKKPNAKFMREMTDVFGKETDAVIKDLQRGEITENVKYLAFNKLLDFQPVALSEVPEQYLKAGNGRIFYMLKTWTIKMCDVYRNEAFGLMKSKDTFKEGFTNIIKLSAALTATGVTADQIKDWLLGRETDFSDRLVDSILKLVTFNRYSIDQMNRQGIGSAFVSKITPPTQAIDSVWRDTMDFLTDADDSFEANNLRTIQSIPVGGKLYYWWFGRASEYKESNESILERYKKASSSKSSSSKSILDEYKK